MKVSLKVWRQKDAHSKGRFERYEPDDVTPEMGLLEVLDGLNETLVERGELPIAFDSDCREGICGACGLLVNGQAHGPIPNITTCQLSMRAFRDGEEIVIEPFRSARFPVVRDLIVDRSVLDRLVGRAGFISVRVGSAPEANSERVAKPIAEEALDAAACIGCGACVAACPNGSAALFAGAKLKHLALLPQGAPERASRAERMAEAMDAEGLGGCSVHGECAVACPAGIDLEVIARLQREVIRSAI
jgi:succinate dehydrogenase / fumarate reductase, iron-sulfur subunit